MKRLAAGLLLCALLILSACNRQQAADPTEGGGDPGLDPRVWYVRNDAPGPVFSGSFETPFAGLAQAEAASRPGDTIFLFAGDGTSRLQDSGIVLKDGQRLVGEAAGFEAAGVPPGSAPVLTNGSGAAITLARNNVVQGLRIEGPAGSGIAGRDVETLVLTDVVIDGAGRDGVTLESRTGPLRIDLRGLTVTGSALTGLRLVASGAADADLVLEGGSFAANAGNALQLSYLGSGDGTFRIGDSVITTLDGSGVRVFVAGTAEQLIEGRVHGVTVSSSDPGTAGDGIAVIVEGDAGALVEVTDNTIGRFGSYGIDLASRGGAGVLEATVTGNVVAEPAGFALAGMRLGAGNGAPGESSTLCLVLEGNRSDTGELPGYQQRQRPGTTYQLQGYLEEETVEAFAAARNQGTVTALGLEFTNATCRTPAF